MQQKAESFYPSEDSKLLVKSYDHVYAILTSLAVLKQYLFGRQATVLADQFLCYSQGFPISGFCQLDLGLLIAILRLRGVGTLTQS
jgi:hypothetical protein